MSVWQMGARACRVDCCSRVLLTGAQGMSQECFKEARACDFLSRTTHILGRSVPVTCQQHFACYPCISPACSLPCMHNMQEVSASHKRYTSLAERLQDIQTQKSERAEQQSYDEPQQQASRPSLADRVRQIAADEEERTQQAQEIVCITNPGAKVSSTCL